MVRSREASFQNGGVWLARSVRAWKVTFVKALMGRKVCPPYATNCRRSLPKQKFCAVAKALVIVSQAGWARF